MKRLIIDMLISLALCSPESGCRTGMERENRETENTNTGRKLSRIGLKAEI